MIAVLTPGRRWLWTALGGLLALTATASCGSGSEQPSGPSIVATTAILGDVVSELVGTRAEVTSTVPAGTSPHDFQPSARQVAQLQDADALVTNGAGFEGGLVDVVDRARADGVATFDTAAAAAVNGDGTAGGRVDPHFFTDPIRMAGAVTSLGTFLQQNVPGLDDAGFRADVDSYVDQLRSLDAEIRAVLDAVPSGRRVLVTSHDVFEPFALRYDFEVAGSLVPAATTAGGASPAELATLARTIVAEGIPAIFVEFGGSQELVRAVADEAGRSGNEVAIVELYTESLGAPGSGAETYVGMLRTNATRIAAALGPAED